MNMKKGAGVILERVVAGPMAVNCYILGDPATREACVIDPGAEPERIKKALKKNNLDLKFILNTHGHGDHIGANGYFKAPVYIHKLDADFLQDSDKNLSAAFGLHITSPAASRLLEDADKVRLGGLELEILHTPGHTPGSVSVKTDGAVFTGDALFRGGIGRTDFSYGDEGLLLDSIRGKLMVLDEGTPVYPGHGEPSTIGDEKRSNPFL